MPKRRVMILACAAATAAALGAAGAWKLRAGASHGTPSAGSVLADADVGAYLAELRSAADSAPETPAGWRELGLACEANGFADDARAAYERALAIDGSDARLRYRLAVVEARAGDVEPALQTMDRVVSAHGDYAPAHWRRGLWLLDLGRTEEAASAFERAIALNADDPAGFVGLARVRLQQHRPAEAAAALEQLLDRSPGDRYALQLLGTAYRQLGRDDEADLAATVGAGGEPIWRDPWTEALAPYRRGYAALLKSAALNFLNGRPDLAVSEFEALRRARPDDVALLTHLSSVYLSVGRPGDAVDALLDAAEREPGRTDVERGLALAWLRQGDATRALEHADRAVAADATSGPAHEARGLALWTLGRAQDAQAALNRSLAEAPHNPTALVALGRMALQGRQLDAAIDSFTRAARQDPLLVDAHVGIARVRLAQGRTAEAAQAVRWVERLAPRAPELAALRGALG